MVIWLVTLFWYKQTCFVLICVLKRFYENKPKKTKKCKGKTQ